MGQHLKNYVISKTPCFVDIVSFLYIFFSTLTTSHVTFRHRSPVVTTPTKIDALTCNHICPKKYFFVPPSNFVLIEYLLIDLSYTRILSISMSTTNHGMYFYHYTDETIPRLTGPPMHFQHRTSPSIASLNQRWIYNKQYYDLESSEGKMNIKKQTVKQLEPQILKFKAM